jgi:hypothetical protein
MCNDLPSPSDWAVESLAVGPKTKTIPNREVISGLILSSAQIQLGQVSHSTDRQIITKIIRSITFS